LTFLGSQSLRAPKLVKKEILLHLDHVKKNPWIFEEDRLKSPSDSTFRAFVVFNYRVVYRIIPDSGEIHILRIRHTSREPKEVN
jgi:plasmid stabilization system protein ParE